MKIKTLNRIPDFKYTPPAPFWTLYSQKGLRCFSKTTGKIVYAYHIDEEGAAYNKDFTLCVGCMMIDLFPQPLKLNKQK